MFDLATLVELLRALSAMDWPNLLGIFLPPFIDLINVRVANAKIKYAISIGVCLLVGIILNYNLLVSDYTDPARLLANLTTVLLAAQTSYALYWEKSKARMKVKEVIEPDAHGKGF